MQSRLSNIDFDSWPKGTHQKALIPKARQMEKTHNLNTSSVTFGPLLWDNCIRKKVL